MKQYLKLCERVLRHGTPVYNKRTGKKCYTVINVDFEYDRLPILTTKKVAWKSAVAELLPTFLRLGVAPWTLTPTKTKNG